MSRHYSATAQPTTLTAGITDSATVIPVGATTGFPAVDFVLALDFEGVAQELVLCTGVAGLNLAVTRGYNGTTAVAHNLGAVVTHVHAAIDFTDSRTHEAATTGVHGTTGALVGTTQAQTLTNKDLSSGTNTFPSSLATDAEVTTAASGAVTTAAAATTAAVAAHAALTATHGVAGAVVGTTDAQTLTNKTLTSPTVTGLTLDGVNVSTAWASWTPSVTGFTVGNGKLRGKYKQIGKTVHYWLELVMGSTSSWGGGPIVVTPPVTPHSAIDADNATPVGAGGAIDVSATAYRSIWAALTGTDLYMYASSGGIVGSAIPWTWANTDSLRISGTYEAA